MKCKCNYYNKKKLAPLLFFIVVHASAQQESTTKQNNYVVLLPSDTPANIIKKAASVTPSPRQLRWQQRELSAFLHFGINTFTNHEWGDGKEDISLFNPKNLDAFQWIKILKEAGFKQVIITAKHHDGFCLWPSKYTGHSVKNTPWKNGKGDVVREVAKACKKFKMGFGVYLSPWDRNSAFYGDSIKYNIFFMNQLTELLTNYGRIDEVWFDGANGEDPNGKKQVYDFNQWYQLIRQIQPQATIAVMGPDVRWVGTENGEGRLTEWSVVPSDQHMQQAIALHSQKDLTFSPDGNMMDDDIGSRSKILHAQSLIWYPAESDVSIRPGWFYHKKEDDSVKSSEKLMDIYFSSVGRNSLLLLNIPPDKDGLINKIDKRSLIGFKRLIDKTFSKNLLKGAKVICSNGLNNYSLAAGKANTYWTTKGIDTVASIEFFLPSKKAFNVISLQENIRIGQRIEKFTFEYKEAGTWKKIIEGTTIGYKRLIRFASMNTSHVRLNIISSRLNPTLKEIGLFHFEGSKKL